jgi:hypothetical protein
MSYSWTTIFWLGDVDTADHEADGPTRLLEEYIGKPRIEAYLGAFLKEVQSIEDLAVQVFVERSVYTAEGVQLDTLGLIVVQPRSGLTDEAYRQFILGKIYANKADGQWPQFIELMNTLGANSIQCYDYYPAAMTLVCTGVDYPDPAGRLVLQMFPGGVRGDFVFSTYDDDDVFETSSTLGSDETDASKGMSDVAETAGGNICGMVTK